MAIVVATTSVAHADEKEKSSKPREASYEWLAPLFLTGTAAGAMALANAEGMDWSRVALDSTLAAVGFGVGMGLGYWFAQVNRQGADKLILGFAAITVASTVAGIGLGELISGHEAFPKGTAWPTTGGLALGVVVDLGAILAVVNAKENQALMVVTMILIPIVVGTTSVAGFSLGLPK